MISRETFIEYLNRALYHLYEPDRLGQNPLAALLGVANRPDTFAVLQRILTEGIQALEPGADEPPASPAWQVYEPLFYRYVQQLDQEQVARQLGMSVRHLRRKEHAAVEALAAWLWQQYPLEGECAAQSERAMANTLNSSPSIAQELAWLRDSPPERPADLAQLLPDTLTVARPLALRHGVRLTLAAGDALPAIPVHEIALSQLLLNLLSMAIPCVEGGEVTLIVSARPEEVEVHIRGQRRLPPTPSQGNRITTAPPEEQSQCGADGSLDVAVQLAQLCSARLTVADTREGFAARLALPTLGQIVVLVIDDNADMLQLVRRFAVGTRYQVVTTQDPGDALVLAERLRPQIIVVDVMMPRIDGWRLLTQLRQQLWSEQCAFIVCTILPQQEMALTLGADAFLQKPITRTTLLGVLDRQIEPMAQESR
jgi:CheY-like chemotaxis protein